MQDTSPFVTELGWIFSCKSGFPEPFSLGVVVNNLDSSTQYFVRMIFGAKLADTSKGMAVSGNECRLEVGTSVLAAVVLDHNSIGGGESSSDDRYSEKF